MSDRAPYDGGDNGRRGRRRASAPVDDDRGSGPSSGAGYYTDPHTDPVRAARDGGSDDPPTDPGRRGGAPGVPGPGGEPAPADRGDARTARPRGRRHRAPDADGPGPSAGPPQQASPEDPGPRSRRRRARSDQDAEEHLAWSRGDSGDEDGGFQPVQPRALDFDAVPVRRKRSRGAEPGEGARGAGRRRSGDTGSVPAVPEQGPERGGADGGRGAGPESGGLAAVEDTGTGSGSGADPRGGRRRRRGDAAEDPRGRPAGAASAPSHEAEAEPAPPRRSRRAPAEPGRDRRKSRRAPAEEPDDAGSGFGAQDGAEDEDREPVGEPGRRRARTGGRDGGRSRSRRPRAAKKRTRRRTFPVVLVCVVLVAGLAGGGYLGRTYLFPPDYEGEGSGGVRITVAEGASGSAVASELADEGVVAGPRAFLNALDADGGNLEPGTYRMNERMSGEAAVAALMDPSSRVKAHITFKEGLRSSEILTLISEETDIPMERLRAALENGEQLGLPGYAEQGAEGYLFPDTYDMPADAGAPALLKRMVDRYHQVAEDVSLKEKADELNLTPDEALSVAAVVQAESGSAEDMPKVARVVYNRLQDGMQLGMDSTCFYVLDEYGIALTSDQVEKCENSGSEYATYGRTGLPAGPIVSPGRDAIEAALEPAEGDWLYFVATDPENGVTEFAETYDEFAQLKQEFERNRSDA